MEKSHYPLKHISSNLFLKVYATAFVLLILLAIPLTVYLALTEQITATSAAGTGAIYYVDSVSGNDSNNGTSESSAWKSLSAVNNRTFSPGDTVNFKKGSSWTGELAIRNSGSSGNPIIYKAYGTGAAPIISNPGSYTHSVTISGANYVVVQDFKVQNAHEAGIAIANGANNNIVQNNECYQTGTCVMVISGQYNLITKNYAHDLTMILNTANVFDDDYGATGYWIYDSNNEISYNRCVNCRATSYDYGFDGGGVEVYADSRTVSNIKIHHNYFKGTNGVMEIGGKNGATSNINISYNVVDNNYEDFMMFHLTGTFAVTLQNYAVDNNTIIQNGGTHILEFGGTPGTGAVNFRNNIVYTNVPVANNSNFNHSNNLYYLYGGASLGFGLSSGEKQADPLFVNVSGGDFHLKSGSPAMNAGANLGYTSDYDGVVVPQGSAPDMGAYEFSTGVNPTPTPMPTSTLPTPTISANTTIINDATVGTGLNQFEYVGTWNTGTGTGKYNQDDHYTDVANSYYQLRFNGTQVKLYGTLDVHHGYGAVLIDGGVETDVNFYSTTRNESTVVWTSPVLTSGNHTVKLRVKGTSPSGSTGAYVTVDRADIINNPLPTPTFTPKPTPTFTPKPTPTTTIPTPTIVSALNGLTGSYYKDKTLTNLVITRIDPTINFNWSGKTPGTSVPQWNFSIRWTGFVTPSYSGTYTFYTFTDDGVRLWVNNQQLVNKWVDQGGKENKGSIALSAGQRYPIRMEYYQGWGNSIAQLLWSGPNTSKQIIPTANLVAR